MAGSFFTVGRDGQIIVQHPFLPNGQLQAGIMVEFDAKPNVTTLKSAGIDGRHLEEHLPGNYTLTIKYDRSNNILDSFQAALDAAKRSSRRVPTGTIYQYVNELDGSVSNWKFTLVTFQVTELGNYKGDDMVKQTLMASAVTREPA